jgi:hypothetical protein
MPGAEELEDPKQPEQLRQRAEQSPIEAQEMEGQRTGRSTFNESWISLISCGTDLCVSSKILLFLSLQINHQKVNKMPSFFFFSFFDP